MGSRPNLPEMLGMIFRINSRVCNLFSYTIPNDET